MGGKLLEQGASCQRASLILLGGVSAVISASDLDGHIFGVDGYKINEHEGALPLISSRTTVEMACSAPSLQCTAVA